MSGDKAGMVSGLVERQTLGCVGRCGVGEGDLAVVLAVVREGGEVGEAVLGEMVVV
jgi:hypothetical protein